MVPEPTEENRPKPQGFRAHKAGCQCPACVGAAKAGHGHPRKPKTKILSRTQEALEAAGVHKEVGEVYNADFPVLYAPPDPNSHRARILRYIELRAQGWKGKDIAADMGVSYETLRKMVWKASKEGWLKFTDPRERFQNEIMPKVVDNIEYWIDKKDKTMTVEAAKGGGVFQSYQAIRMEGQAQMTVLALKIEPAPREHVQVLEGHVVGVPKQIEGEVDGGK